MSIYCYEVIYTISLSKEDDKKKSACNKQIMREYSMK